MPFLVLVFVGLPALLGVGMLVAAHRAAAGRSDLRTSGTSTSGTVVDSRTGDPAPPGWYLPVVEFRTDSGRLVRALGDQPSRRRYLDGVQIPVSYDPRSPTRVTVGPDRARTLRVGGVISLLMAAGMGVVLLVLV